MEKGRGFSVNPSKLLQDSAINREATRKKVEGALETARIYNQIGFVRKESRIVSGYEPRYHGSTNAVSKVTEQVAVYNVETEYRLKHLSEQVEQAVQCLDTKEQDIVRRRYLQRESEFDFLLCHELGMSERTYRRVKAKAFSKLAFMLRLEVAADKDECADSETVGKKA
jgi:ArpU family phage transcriptional regulator